MRDGWTVKTLGEMTSRRIEAVKLESDQQYVNLGVKWYAEGTFQREPKFGAEIKASKLFRVRPGQFVYNRLFATEGSFAVIKDEDAEAVASNEFPVFDVDAEQVLPAYLRLYFQQPDVWSRVGAQCVGTTKSRLRWKEQLFAAFTMPTPPLAEQSRIIDLLQSVDGALASAEVCAGEALRGLSALREVLTTGSESVLVGDVLEELRRPVDLDATENYTEIGVRSHGRGVFLKEPVAGDGFGTKKVFWMTPGALVFNIVFAWEGAVALLGDDAEGLIASHRFPNYTSTLDSGVDFMAEFFKTKAGVQLLADCSPGGAGRNRTLNRGRLLGSTVLVPPAEEWPTVVDTLRAATARWESAVAYVESLRNLRSNLLTVLLSGEHEIPESYDELMETVA